MNWYDIGERALWTFVQAAAGTATSLAIGDAVGVVSISDLATIGLSALGAGVGALLSLAKTIAQERLKRFDTRTR